MLMIVPRKGEKLKIIASSLSCMSPGKRVSCTACISLGGAPFRIRLKHHVEGKDDSMSMTLTSEKRHQQVEDIVK